MNIIKQLIDIGPDAELTISLKEKFLIWEAKENIGTVSLPVIWDLKLFEDDYTRITSLPKYGKNWKDVANQQGLAYNFYRNNSCGLSLPSGKDMIVKLTDEDWNYEIIANKDYDEVWIDIKYGNINLATKYKVIKEYL